MTDETHDGGCMCGAVRFRASGEPKRVGICHCITCRKNTGAPFGAFAVYPKEQVTIVSGETGFFQSSPEGKRHFCRACGSPVFSEWSDAGTFELYVGSLDDPARFEPSYELWTLRRLSWLPAMDVPGYERNRTD